MEKAVFIECPGEFDAEYSIYDPAPMFRRKFTVRSTPERAVLSVCGLGFGNYYLDGKQITEDKFIAPVSDYNKTLWYNAYDITAQLEKGEHLLAVMLGNGFYNESLNTAWDFNRAPWRGKPKLWLNLEIVYSDSTEYIVSNEEWHCCREMSPLRFNQLRSGEIFDSRFLQNWMSPELDDRNWGFAKCSENVPSGVFRKCKCEPIRETVRYKPKSIFKNCYGDWVIDYGQNMSGYLRVTINQPSGDCIKFCYAEELTPDGTRKTNQMDDSHYYADGRFQTDELICSGKTVTHNPLFTYHGFRYVIISGLRKKPEKDNFIALFVHQTVRVLSSFSCSVRLIDDIYHLGRMSTLSNLFYSVTDCPTREKLGWTNDAAASAEQMLLNYGTVNLFEKWIQDIRDAQRMDGSLPGIVPTGGWGYDWGSGPISNDVLFEIPYQIWRYSNNKDMLCHCLPNYIKYLSYVSGLIDANDGLIGFGLCDWAGPFEHLENAPTPLKLTDTLLVIKFCRITALAAKLSGNTNIVKYADEIKDRLLIAFNKAYIDPKSGRCSIPEQTALSMIIVMKASQNLEPLKAQLVEAISSKNWHLNCGMLGMRFLYEALDICGMQADAYRIITASGRPSYREWLENGATSMWEMWNTGSSKNHHMHSVVLMWFVKSLLGLRQEDNSNAFRNIRLKPYFPPDMKRCAGSFNTASGLIEIRWSRKDGHKVEYTVSLPNGVNAILCHPSVGKTPLRISSGVTTMLLENTNFSM